MRRVVMLLGCVAALILAPVAECRDFMKCATPQGQTLTVMGEARDRSALIEQGRAAGYLSRAPLKAFVEIENLRGSNLMIAGAIDLTSSHVLNWPAGQWVECVLTDGTVHRVRRIFTCGPREELRVIELGRESKQVPLGQLYSARVKGIDYVGPPIYMAVPNTKVNGTGGRTHWMDFRDIASIRFVHIPVDSLTAVAERRQ